MSGNKDIKLGIGCVYFFRNEDAWLLDMQLDFIQKTTCDTDFTVYAAANRLQPHLKERLAARPFVKIIDLPPFEGDGGPEHGHYLSQLIKIAKEDGCTHACTLDCDSFPVTPNWVDKTIEEMGTSYKVASVFRAENQDSDLPHPCGTFLDCSLLDEIDIDFWPSDATQMTTAFKEYIAETRQRIDTGTGLGFALWKAQIPWLKLLRSNRTNLHYLMAGIYGDVFFHLGASSRNPAFYSDFVNHPGLKLSLMLQPFPILWRIGAWFEKRYILKNQRLSNSIRDQIKTNPEAFIQKLR